ncbi:MAG TPA: DUF692 domain-containing protein, partial [Polyangiales bacterium]|nr:DUF692 domain-containing protein [Polyangiales bacterium]
DFLEILSDNYLYTEGRPLYFLDRIAERYPLVMHGVGLSIGSTDPLDFDYLRRLRALRERTGARWISDHLCWTGVAGQRVHDLLPLPYDAETLRHVAERVRVVQDFLGERILLENPSTYLELSAGSMLEEQFLAALALEADCGILLDLNNVYVSAFNHERDPHAYLRALPLERVGQLHVAGHTRMGTHIVDSHVGPVSEPVWSLLERFTTAAGNRATLLEWDADIPALERVHEEALRASAHRRPARADGAHAA